MTVVNACSQHPNRLQLPDIPCRDLKERTVPPAVVGAPDHQPVTVFRVYQARSCHRPVILQYGWNRDGRLGRRRLCSRRLRRLRCSPKRRCKRPRKKSSEKQGERPSQRNSTENPVAAFHISSVGEETLLHLEGDWRRKR